MGEEINSNYSGGLGQRRGYGQQISCYKAIKGLIRAPMMI